jgi:membrane protein
LRVFLLSLRGFDEDQCLLRASALTFFSLLSIVPIFAMAFGVAKGFGLEKLLENQLLQVEGQQEVLRYVITFAHSLLENTQGGVVAGIGVAILFWSVLKVLGNIELSFNEIWGVKEARSFGRKLSDYLALMMICPILLILSSSITVFIASQLALIVQQIPFLNTAWPLIALLLRVLSFAVIWTLFTFIYIFMPNTQVNFKSGLMGGILAGTIYQLAQWVYIKFQIGVASYGAVYGSFAALPLFLVWLQTSWLVVLYGAEIAFAHQNVDTYEFEPDSRLVSHSFKKLLSLQVAHLCVKSFCAALSPLSAHEISEKLSIPIRLVRQLLHELVHSGILSETRSDNRKEGAYQPARDVGTLTLGKVLEALDARGSDNIPLHETSELTRLGECLRSMSQRVEQDPANLLLKEI